jgi:uncharacterized protein
MITSLSLCLAAFAFSFAGFGYGLIAVPLLALIVSVKTAVAIQFPFSVLLVLLNTWQYGRKLQWRDLKPLFIGAAIAIPLGVLSLNWLPELVMKRTLAVFIVLTIISRRIAWKDDLLQRFAKTFAGGVFLGVISGWFTGAYTTGGPPAVIYATGKFSNIEKAKGIMGVYFLFTDIVLMLLFLFTGVVTMETLKQSFMHTPAVVIGLLLGLLSLKRVRYRGYMAGVDCLLVVAAAMLSLNF